MNDFFNKTGPMAIATRMRLLSEKMTKESEKIFDLYNVNIKPKWYPVFYCLMQEEQLNTVTEIAEEVKQSHVSILKIVKEMVHANIIFETKGEEDKRKTILDLTTYGKEVAKGLELQHQDVTIMMQEMLSQSKHNLWYALDEFESLLLEQSTYPRVLEQYRKREASKIEIVEFEPQYTKAFAHLNEAWINQYFKMEEKDQYSLRNPQESIIDEGGYIVVALYEGKAVGVCALMKSSLEEYEYEMAKMAVDENYQGKGIGLLLGNAIIEKAKTLKVNVLFLESNTVLTSAINLYKKLGFKKIQGYSSPYERSNIQMELILN